MTWVRGDTAGNQKGEEKGELRTITHFLYLKLSSPPLFLELAIPYLPFLAPHLQHESAKGKQLSGETITLGEPHKSRQKDRVWWKAGLCVRREEDNIL